MMDVKFELTAELCAEASESLETEILRFSSQPDNFKGVKEKIEECCSIPECVQTVVYQGSVVSDCTSLQSLYVRSGDSVRVKYPHKGLVQEVKTIVKWLEECTKILLDFQDALNCGNELSIPEESKAILEDQNPPNLLDKKLFTLWSDSRTSVNALHFDCLGGMQLLVNFHKVLLNLRKSCVKISDIDIPYLEFICCKGIANFAMNNDCSRRVAQCGGLDSCIGSFLFKPADDESLFINHNYTVLVVALRAIFNIAEIPEVQYQLSCCHDVIQQAFLTTATSAYSTLATAKRTVCVLVCLSRSSAAHENLLTPELVEKLMKLLEICEETQEAIDHSSKMMAIRSYVGILLAQMICKSSYLLHKFQISLLERMSTLIKKACEGDAVKIQQYEETCAFYWGTFLPCLEYIYEPYVQTPKDNSPHEFSQSLIETLRIFSVDVLLQYLVTSLGRSIHVDLIVQESLIDFVTCLPWIVPLTSKERARNVLRELGKFQQIQPPSLVSITKAYLAKAKWGLNKLMNLNSVSDLCITV